MRAVAVGLMMEMGYGYKRQSGKMGTVKWE
jgi:hypothetical protein